MNILPDSLLIIRQSFLDICDDLEELAYLSSSSLFHVRRFTKDFKKIQRSVSFDLFDIVSKETVQLNIFFSKLLERISHNKKSVPKEGSLDELERFSQEVQSIYLILRSLQTRLGALVTSLDYQSPSFLHSLTAQAGVQAGKIIGTINDYKRDRHLDEEPFQQMFRKEYIDGSLKIRAKVYLTNNGMAAFTTILNFLILEKKLWGEVLVGQNIYFQNKDLLVKLLGNRLVIVDEFKIDEILHAIDTHQFCAAVFDTLSNTSSVAVPDLSRIIPRLAQSVKRDTYLVIDNTCLSVFCQPLKHFLTRLGKLHCIVFESLNKYYQFGFDKVTGGIIYAVGKDTIKFSYYRTHLGTNISDSTVYALPFPNRKLLEKRLMRHHRNATILSSYLEDFIAANPKSTCEGIVYPGLPSHLCYAWTKHMPFHGSFFVLSFKPRYRTVESYKKFVSKVFDEAKRRRVPILSGTSFGLNISRIYLTATRTDATEPFIRVSVGTETAYGVERLKDIFTAVIQRFRSSRLMNI